MKKSELEKLEVYQWADIAENWSNSDLFLGNGFSIRLSNSFRYSALFNRFLEELESEQAERFEAFGTTNFEAIQHRLQDAKAVNELFELPTEPIGTAIEELRDGLIKTIEQNHPRALDIDKELLDHYAATLEQFGNIFTTNYDLYLYLIIMVAKDRFDRGDSRRKYNDFFWGESDNQRLREFRDSQNYPHYDHVFYLHGALFIFPGEPEIKVMRCANEELIEVIAHRIRAGEMPVFVSEGSASEKRRSIADSKYLRFAQRELEGADEYVVIYGASLGDEDAHILEALSLKNRHIAVSVYTPDKDEKAIRRSIARYRERLSDHKLTFYDSESLFPDALRRPSASTEGRVPRTSRPVPPKK